MNKEFLDPNTRYSDQKVDLAKMPGVLQTINQSLGEMVEKVREIPVLQQQVGQLSSTVEDIDDNVGDIQDTLSTTGATAGQVLKVETPGEAPVWGEAGGGGSVTSELETSLYLRDSEFNNAAHNGLQDAQGSNIACDYTKAWVGATAEARFWYEDVSGTKNGQSVTKHFAIIPYLVKSGRTGVKVHALVICTDGVDPEWSTSTSSKQFKFYVVHA